MKEKQEMNVGNPMTRWLQDLAAKNRSGSGTGLFLSGRWAFAEEQPPEWETAGRRSASLLCNDRFLPSSGVPRGPFCFALNVNRGGAI